VSKLNILDLYLEQEILMAQLYQRFESRYAAHKEFWLSLIAEEREHAGYIDHLRAQADRSRVSFDPGNIRVAGVQSVIAYLKRLIEEFDRHPFLFQKAIAICVDLERSILEQKVFSQFETDSPELGQLLEILRSGQTEHIKKVSDFHAKFKDKAS